MKQSLSYYITLFVIKLKGLKKDFSKDPIDYKKIRKEDVRHPKGRFFTSNQVSTCQVANSLITEVKQKESSDNLLLFIPGGAFISGPAKHHWDSIKEIAKHSNWNIWLCDYPKAPENNIHTISENIDQVYKAALEKYQAKNIILIGDSVGGTLIIALTQRLVKNNIDLPKKIILVSPVMDATLSNPKIPAIDIIDPMLSKAGVLSAKKMCAANLDLNDPLISPINGDFNKFPNTVIFLAEHDITYPDQQRTVEKMRKAKVKVEVIEGKRMPHIWPFLPVMKEAGVALREVIARLE